MKRKRPLLVITAVAIAVHALIFLATARIQAASGKGDIAAVSWSLTYYYDYASKVMAGQVPYRDFPFEYPVLSLPLFLVPRLLTSDLAGFKAAFMAEMFLFDAAAIVLIARRASEAGDEGTAVVVRRLGWYTVPCLLLAPLMIGRFEVPPMVLAFAAAAWWSSGRAALGGTAAGLGALLKVFPGAVAVPALVREVASLRVARPRGTVAFLATLAIGLAGWLWLAGDRMGESLGYHAERGLEVESLCGGLVLLAGAAAGKDVPCVFDHNSFHVAAEYGSRLAALAFPIQAATLLLVAWRYWRTGLAEAMRYSTAAVVAFIVAGKVLSPQYLIWPLPFLAVLDGPAGRLARQVFLLACLTTALIYPGPVFPMILEHQLGAILLLNVRNGLMLWLLGVLLFGPAGDDLDARTATGTPGLRPASGPGPEGS